MSHNLKNLLSFTAYVAGGIVLTLSGPGLWDVHQLVATIAAIMTTVCFITVHVLVDTRRIARQALVLALRRRTELVALGKYVTRIERTIQQAPVPIADATTPEPALTSNLLQFAAHVSARCSGGDAAAEMQNIVSGAIADGRVELHLQPIVRLPGRQTAHYEALSRIRDESGNVILPAKFLPAASAAGIAAELETQQLASVIALCNRIGQRHTGTRIFCNLSVEALQSDKFRAELTGFMEAHAELAQRITFEMDAKTVLALNAEAVADVRGLDELGFAFSVDGASLAGIGGIYGIFPRVAFAKINAGELIGADPNVISSLIKRGTEVIAVRIETERQALETIELGVGYGQGYLFGQPCPAKSDTPRLQRAA